MREHGHNLQSTHSSSQYIHQPFHISETNKKMKKAAERQPSLSRPLKPDMNQRPWQHYDLSVLNDTHSNLKNGRMIYELIF